MSNDKNEETILVDSSGVRAYIWDSQPDDIWVSLPGVYFTASPQGVSIVINKQQLAALSEAYRNLPVDIA